MEKKYTIYDPLFNTLSRGDILKRGFCCWMKGKLSVKEKKKKELDDDRVLGW